MAGDGDIFVATGMVAVFAVGPRNRAGDLIRIDAPVGQDLGEIPRLAIGPGGMGSAFFAPGEALVDAVTVGLVGDDENAAVGGCGRGGERQDAGQKPGNGSHGVPGNERIARVR